MPSPTSVLAIGVLISLNVTLLTFVHLLCPVSPLLEIRGMESGGSLRQIMYSHKK